MKTTALQKMIDAFKEPWPRGLWLSEREALSKEAHDELQVLLDEAAWAHAAEEEIDKLKAEVAAKDDALRKAFEWSRYVAASKRENTQEFLDELFSTGEKLQKELQAALSPPTGKVLVSIEELLDACTNLEMAPAGEDEVYRCLLCDHHSLTREGINHDPDCWLAGLLQP